MGEERTGEKGKKHRNKEARFMHVFSADQLLLKILLQSPAMSAKYQLLVSLRSKRQNKQPYYWNPWCGSQISPFKTEILHMLRAQTFVCSHFKVEAFFRNCLQLSRASLLSLSLKTVVHCSVAKPCQTLCDPYGLQHTRLPCPSLSPRVCSNSCPLCQR